MNKRNKPRIENPNQQTELEKILDQHVEQISEEIKKVKIPRGTTSIEVQIGKIITRVEISNFQ